MNLNEALQHGADPQPNPHYIEETCVVPRTTLLAVIDALVCGQSYIIDRLSECSEQKTLKDQTWRHKLSRDNQLLQEMRDKVSSLTR